MNLVSLNQKISKLFVEKKYKQVIELIESSFDQKNLNTQYLNILGAAKLFCGDKDQIDSSIECFKKGYLKEKVTKNALDAFTNYIQTSLNYKKLGDLTQYFSEAINDFGYDEKMSGEILRTYLYLNNTQKAILFLSDLINHTGLNKKKLQNYVFYNLLESSWSQEDFFHYSKKISSLLKNFSKDKLLPLNKIKNLKKKIAFVSSDIKKKHSVTYFLKSVLEGDERKNFEIIIVSNSKKNTNDKNTLEFKLMVDEWIDIDDLQDFEAMNLLRSKNFDIAIDLMGFTSDNKLEFFKERIAPIQISWLGYCNTSGIDEIDFLIADKNLIYPGEENLYVEKVIYLPKIWNCHSGIEKTRVKKDSPFLKNNFITFGSFNNFLKISEKTIQTWAKILQSVKNSKLILKSSRHQHYDEIFKKFKDYDIDKSIIIEKTRDFESHIDLYSKIDLALDTFPYNGVTTSFEALWTGTPIIVMKGNNFNSRCGESIIKNLGINSLIANNMEDYVEKTVNLANNHDQLELIRNQIFHNVLKTPLFDKNTFCRDFYKTLESL